jgi:hypothetical protein
MIHIVFGTYSFPIKTYRPRDLGIQLQDDRLVFIEVRQQIFHLCWIPVFPVGRVYALKNWEKVYELPAEYKNAIEAAGPVKRPLYATLISFALPLLLFAGVSIYAVNETYKNKEERKNSLEWYAGEVAALDSALNKLSTNNYIEIRCNKGDYDGKSVYLKVDSIKDSTITCALLIKRDVQGPDDSPFAVREFYRQHRQQLDTFHLTFSDIRKNICRDYDLYYYRVYQGFGSDLLHKGDTFYVQKIRYIDEGPSIHVGSGSYGNELSMDIENDGYPARLVAIKNLNKNLKWNDTLPIMVEGAAAGYPHNRFELSAPNPKMEENFKVLLVFEDSAKREYKFRLDGSTVTRVFDAR